MANVIHECPADGSMHENSEHCDCQPTRLADDANGNRIYRHHPFVVLTAAEARERCRCRPLEGAGLVVPLSKMLAGAD